MPKQSPKMFTIKILLSIVALSLFSYLNTALALVGLMHHCLMYLAAGTIVGIWKWDGSYILYGATIGFFHVMIISYGKPAVLLSLICLVIVIALIWLRARRKYC